jgi:hypothetical protein
LALFFIIKPQEVMKFSLIGETNRYTTIPNHTGDLPEGTLRAILNSSGIEERRIS